MWRRLLLLAEIVGAFITLGSLLGIVYSAEANRGAAIALAIVLALAGAVGLFFLVLVIQNVRQPPYND